MRSSKTVIIIIVGILVLGLIGLLAYVSFKGANPGSLIAGLTLLWGSIRARLFGKTRGMDIGLAAEPVINTGAVQAPIQTLIPVASGIPQSDGSMQNSNQAMMSVPVTAPVALMPAPQPVRQDIVGRERREAQIPMDQGILRRVSKGESKYLWLLDNGHGGLINGRYQTQGKRSPTMDDGRVVFEGVFNRDIVNGIARRCAEENIDYEILVPTARDIALHRRSRKANEILLDEMINNDRKCILVSVHANAHEPEGEFIFNDAHGIETFYFMKNGKESQNGKKAASVFQKHMIAETGRRDRGAKGKNLHMVRETKMTSLLTECGFMTNPEEARLLLDPAFKTKIIEAHVNAMLEIEKAEMFG